MCNAFLKKKKKDFICLFLAALGLCWCSSFSLVMESGSYFLGVVHGLLIARSQWTVEQQEKPMDCRAVRL